MSLIPGQDTVIPHAAVKSLHSQKKKNRAVVQGHGGHLCLLIGFTEAKENFLTS